MKLRYILTAIAATLVFATACEKENNEFLDEIQVSSSYVSLPVDGGSSTITITANDTWSFDNGVPSWMTIEPSSGTAGQTKVTFTAEATLDGRSGSINILCGGKTQIINYIQGLPVVSSATCAEVIAGPDSKTYLVTGTCTAIANTSYGNFYLQDSTGEIYIYGTVDASGSYNWSTFNIEVGDEVTVQGPKTTYGSTVELVDATFISVNKSLIKVDSLTVGGKKITEVPIEGAEVVANVTCKGKGISVDIPADAQSWLSVTGINTATGKVNFTVAPNSAGDRSVELTFKTTDGSKDYTAVTTVAQKGSIIETSIAGFLAAAEDDTQYRISGIVTKLASDSEKYGANLYLKDATGEVYIYGTTNADGTVKTLASFGAKEGDIVEFVGKRSSYKGTAQMTKGAYQSHKTVTKVTAAEAAALDDDDKKDPQNYISLTGVVTTASGSNKTDLETYGNFDLVDASGSIYVYGVSTGWNGETKKFGTLGVKLGDEITIVAYKTSYKSNAQVVGMYVSHETPAAAGTIEIKDTDLPTSYTTEATTITSGGYEFNVTSVANYGNGIQFKKQVGVLETKSALDQDIKSIKIYKQKDKDFYPDNVTVTSGEQTFTSTTEDEVATFDLSGGSYKTFKIANLSTYAAYYGKIVVELATE